MAETLAAKLAAARREAQEQRRQLETAEQDLAVALDERRYADAEKLKDTVDGLRQPVLIADAHVQALQAGVDALAAQQEADRRAQADRERREQAEGLMETARARQAEATDDVERLLQEIPVAFQELRRLMDEAEAAQVRAAQAMVDFHHAGVAAGHIDQGAPPPWGWNRATAWIEASPVLMAVRRTDHLQTLQSWQRP